MMFGSAKLRKDLCFIFICSKSLPLESINGDVETVNPCVLVPCKVERHRLQEMVLDRGKSYIKQSRGLKRDEGTIV